ncbi:MAG: DUF2807 domain-containing protein [Alistipes sp.]|nr:DUF2807 domain-containing protein [Alistipes sp.]
MKRFLWLWVMMVWCGMTLSAQTQMVRLTRFEGQHIVGVDVSSSFQVKIVRSDRPYAVVEVPAKYEADLKFTLDPQGVIHLGFSSSTRIIGSTDNFQARIYLSELSAVRLSGASTADCEGRFESNESWITLRGASNLNHLTLDVTGALNLDCSESSDVKNMVLNCRELNSDVSGASRITMDRMNGNLYGEISGASRMVVAGSAGIVSLKVSGASRFDGLDMSIRDGHLTASSASKVCMGSIQGDLTANGSGASSITYRGNPTIRSIVISSASSVKKEL